MCRKSMVNDCSVSVACFTGVWGNSQLSLCIAGWLRCHLKSGFRRENIKMNFDDSAEDLFITQNTFRDLESENVCTQDAVNAANDFDLFEDTEPAESVVYNTKPLCLKRNVYLDESHFRR